MNTTTRRYYEVTVSFKSKEEALDYIRKAQGNPEANGELIIHDVMEQDGRVINNHQTMKATLKAGELSVGWG
jgi:hypothetical protein